MFLPFFPHLPLLIAVFIQLAEPALSGLPLWEPEYCVPACQSLGPSRPGQEWREARGSERSPGGAFPVPLAVSFITGKEGLLALTGCLVDAPLCPVR